MAFKLYTYGCINCVDLAEKALFSSFTYIRAPWRVLDRRNNHQWATFKNQVYAVYIE